MSQIKPQPEPAITVSLPASVSSAQDIQSLIFEVKNYAKWLSHDAIKCQLASAPNGAPSDAVSDAANSDSEAPVLSAAAGQLINGAGNSAEGLDGLIADLEDLCDNSPQLTITLAAPVSGELKRTLVAWCRANIEADVLVSFQFNSTILGGLVVRYGSRIFDWSFRRQILDKDKDSNITHFAEILRRA